MSQNQNNPRKVTQKVKIGRDGSIVGGSIISSFNIQPLILILGIFLAFGGMSLAVVFGLNNNGQNPQSGKIQPSPNPTATKKP